MAYIFFFFNDTATTEIYTLSLHDALPILGGAPFRVLRARGGAFRGERPGCRLRGVPVGARRRARPRLRSEEQRLNSSHANISYAVFCLKKKQETITPQRSVETSYKSKSSN